MSTPKFLSIPTAYKANKIYSVVPDSGDGDLTFTRASIRTRRNSEGSVEQLATGVPALNYSADETCPKWSFEPTRTNLLPYSDTSDFTLYQVTRAAQAYNGINGYLYNGIGTSPNIYKRYLSPVAGYYTYSCFVDITDNANFKLIIFTESGPKGASVLFYSDTKTFGTITENNSFVRNSTTKATRIIDNIYRLELTTELISAYSDVYSYIGFDAQLSNVWIGGAQLEKGYGATSLIETNGSTLQRLYDSATLGNLQTNGLLGATEGCVYLEIDTPLQKRDLASIQFSIGAANGQIYFGNASATNPEYNQIIIKSSDATANSYNLTQSYNKILFNYSASNVDLWVNGIKVLSTGKAFSLTSEIMGINGVARKWDLGSIAMYNTKQTDELCQQLTTL